MHGHIFEPLLKKSLCGFIKSADVLINEEKLGFGREMSQALMLSVDESINGGSVPSVVGAQRWED